MRLLVAGVNEFGRSAIVREEELPTDGTDERLASSRKGGTGLSFQLWKTEGYPPVVERPGDKPSHGIGTAPGDTIWRVWTAPPHGTSAVHRTDTLSYNHLVSGSVELVLEEASVLLGPGDLLVCLGVLHGWNFGPEGGVMVSAVIGLDPV